MQRFSLCLMAAITVHALLFLSKWNFAWMSHRAFTPSPAFVEVTLVEAAPVSAAPVVESASPVPSTEPPPVESQPAPVKDAPPAAAIPIPAPDPVRVEQPARRLPRAIKPRSAREETPGAGQAAVQTTAAGHPSASTVPRGGDAQAGYLSNPHPPYPVESKLRHEEGIVMLAVSINATGAVSAIRVKQSSGFPRLDQAARDGVQHWVFRPARAGGAAVPAEIVVPVRFRLRAS